MSKKKANLSEKITTSNVVSLSERKSKVSGFVYPDIPWDEIGDIDAETRKKILEYFPSHVNPGIQPTGDFILIQYQLPPNKVGSLYIPETGMDIFKAEIVVARVLALGPLAFRNKSPSLDENGQILRNPDGSAVFEEWPEGAYVRPGQFVRSVKMAPDRWGVEDPNSSGRLIGFGLCRERDIAGVIIGNPLDIKKYWGHI